MSLSELDSIIARLRYVMSGDIVEASDHNDLVEAIKKIREILDTIGGGAQFIQNSFAYFALSGNVVYGFRGGIYWYDTRAPIVLYNQEFTDKAVLSICSGYFESIIVGRWRDNNNMYWGGGDSYYKSLFKAVNNVWTELGEVRDNTLVVTGYGFPQALSVSGSAIKYMWWGLPPNGVLDPVNQLDWLANNVRGSIVATDTDLVSGLFGVEQLRTYYDGAGATFPISAFLIEPMTRLRGAVAVIEAEAINENGAIKPSLLHDYVVDPRFSKIYNKLRSLGLEDEEINTLIRIPRIDRLAVAYGTIDYKRTPTMFLAIFDGSDEAIRRQVDYARSRNLFADFVKPTLDYVRELHRRIKRDNPDMLITENELSYQLLGLEELEVDAVADFYRREVLDLKRLDPSRIADFYRTMDMWTRRAEKHKRPSAETFRKLKRI